MSTPELSSIILRYWLSLLRQEEALTTRPKARRLEHPSLVTAASVATPTAGQDYVKLPFGEVASFYEAGVGPNGVHVRLIEPDLIEPLTVMGRETPLSQVFRNLIDNARSFSVPGGEVRIVLSRTRGRVVAAIEDDGPGIPTENLETVFERFYTSRPKGSAFGGNSGLGLSIARQIIEAHQGAIRAENRLGQRGEIIGARFIVSLPTARA